MPTRNAYDSDAVRTMVVSATGELSSYYDVDSDRLDYLGRGQARVGGFHGQGWLVWWRDDSRQPVNSYAEHVAIAANGGPIDRHIYGEAHFFGTEPILDEHGGEADLITHVPEVVWQAWVLLLVMRGQAGSAVRS